MKLEDCTVRQRIVQAKGRQPVGNVGTIIEIKRNNTIKVAWDNRATEWISPYWFEPVDTPYEIYIPVGKLFPKYRKL
jgi:hypothetical protein